MESLSERLEALALTLPVKTVLLFTARSSRGKSRTYHLSRSCKRFRASHVDQVTFTSQLARAVCPVCVVGFPSQPDLSGSHLAYAALEFLRSAVGSLGRAQLHAADSSLSDVWAGRALRVAEIASGLGVPEVAALASEVVVAARELTVSTQVDSEAFAAAELACAFVHASRLSPLSSEDERLLGGGDRVSRFVTSMMRRLCETSSREEFLGRVVEDVNIFFGSEPQWASQLPDRPFPLEPLEPGVSVRDWAYASWRSARDELVSAAAARWYDQGALTLAAAARRSLIFARCSPRGDLAAMVSALGASRVPDRYVVVFEDVADSTVTTLRLLAERDTKVVVSERISREVLEVAVGLYDPRSSGPLSKLAGALNAAKAC